jgi:rhodanese-related sulfurtransferase
MSQLFEFVSNHPLLVGLFAVLLALFIRNETQRGGRNVSTQELVNLINREGAIVLDVRDAKEFAAGHIVGALNIPHSALESRIGELQQFKEKPLTIVCKMGQQAGTSGALLRKAGFAEVARLAGGMSEWRNQNLPVVKG